jgi:hypothetical protein
MPTSCAPTPDISPPHADASHMSPQKEKSMTTIQRFVLKEDDIVVDVLNPTGPTGCYFEGQPKDEIHLREKILWKRIFDPVYDLIINLQLEEPGPNATKYKPPNKEAFALFRDDIECLLRDLYGDIDSEALERALGAVLTIVKEFTQFVRKYLWQEHLDAMNWDYIWGIGLPEGYCISGSDHRRAMKAIDDLRILAREVSENPSAFSKYTVEFATIHLGSFIKLEPEDASASECFEMAVLAEKIKNLLGTSPSDQTS